MTQAFIVLAAIMSALLFAAEGSNNSGPAKLLVIVLMIGSMGLHLIGLAITSPRRLGQATGEVLRDFWPLVALALFILAGSGFARFAEQIPETFIGFGVGMLFLPMMAVSVRAAKDPMGLMRSLGAVYVSLALVMLVLLVLRRFVYHEEVYVAVPLCGYFLCARPLKAWHAALGAAVIAASLSSFKNTTFLLVLTALGACAFLWVIRATRTREKLVAFSMLYFGVLTTACVVGSLIAAWLHFREHLPSGSTEYRMEMYGIAWRRFLSSPMWGTAFTDSAVTYFELYKVDTPMQTLPTHSDVIDLLAHGGLLAIGLWLTVVWRVISILLDTVRALSGVNAPSLLQPWRWLLVLSLINVGAVLTYAFNPVLHRPVQAVWVWGTLGVSWALHRMLTTNRLETSPSRVRATKAFA